MELPFRKELSDDSFVVADEFSPSQLQNQPVGQLAKLGESVCVTSRADRTERSCVNLPLLTLTEDARCGKSSPTNPTPSTAFDRLVPSLSPPVRPPDGTSLEPPTIRAFWIVSA